MYKYIYSSSLKPGTPTVSSASLEGDKCRIKIRFPVNVDIEDTWTYFVCYTFLFVNTYSTGNVNKRLSQLLNFFMF